MTNVTKLIAGITALLVAVGALIGTVRMSIGREPDTSTGITIVLKSPEAYEDFISNHSSNG